MRGFPPGRNPTYTLSLRLATNDGDETLATDTVNVKTVPEPASMALLGAGLLGLALRRRRRA